MIKFFNYVRQIIEFNQEICPVKFINLIALNSCLEIEQFNLHLKLHWQVSSTIDQIIKH